MTKRLKVLFVGGSALFLSGSAPEGLPATAMLALADLYPEDDDLQTLAAEALMDTTPWN